MALFKSDFLLIYLKTFLGQYMIIFLLSCTINSPFISFKVGNAILYSLALIVFAAVSLGCLKHLEKLDGKITKLIAFYFIICPVSDFLNKAFETIFNIS